jgi:hypothetical protein
VAAILEDMKLLKLLSPAATFLLVVVPVLLLYYMVL